MHQAFAERVSFVPVFFDRGDLCGISLTFPSSGFRHYFSSLSIYNIYNRHLTRHTRSISPFAAFPRSTFPSLVLGDFNIHHPSCDPDRTFLSPDLILSEPYFEQASESGYVLLNTTGSYTRLASHNNERSGAIDLAFANNALLPFIQSWQNNLPATGSDHTAIKIKISSPTLRVAVSSPQWECTPWPLLTSFILNFTPTPLATPGEISNWFDRNLQALTVPVLAITPTKRPSSWSKKWWSPDISQLRTIFHSVARAYRKGMATRMEVKATKTAYFSAIKVAKSKHWNEFVNNANTKDLWAIHRLRKPKDSDTLPSFPNAATPLELNKALVPHFFPPMPTQAPPAPRFFVDAQPISSDEVTRALKKCSNTSTPGPDQIPYGTWKSIHSINPHAIPQLLTPLLVHGHHAQTLKAANGIVLPKPAKPSYSDPSSFRIIVLLETISKVLERIVTFRLYAHAVTCKLIHPNQGGSLPGRSVTDAATTLLHEVKLLQASSLKVSSLFLDIKGGFDNVRAPILAARLNSYDTPTYMINWILSFLSNRTCRLLFKGGPMTFEDVDVGVPQGSPISPLLFVI